MTIKLGYPFQYSVWREVEAVEAVIVRHHITNFLSQKSHEKLIKCTEQQYHSLILF